MRPEWAAALEPVAAAAAHAAAAVDRDARFPGEAMGALRTAGLLGAMVPRDYGGFGASIGDLVMICQTLAQACASTALIYAMHQCQLASLIEHATENDWQRALLRDIAERQLLIGSVTSEETIGGDVRSSVCAVTPDDAGGFTIAKASPSISYGSHADLLLVTARRGPAAAPSDQVLVAARREDYRLEQKGGWDTLGMRGTCSEGFAFRMRGQPAQILSRPFSEISAATMLPASHIFWSAVWIGIATDAVARARAYLRSHMRRTGDGGPSAHRLTDATGALQMLQARLRSSIGSYDALHARADAEPNSAFGSEMNMLKVGVSETALQVVGHAMLICGISAYRNDTPFSLGRHLRDLQSAPLMINNDRIVASTAQFLLAQRSPVVSF